MTADWWFGIGLGTVVLVVIFGVQQAWLEWQDRKHARATLVKWDEFVAELERKQ